MAWPQHAEEVYQAMDSFLDNERAIDAFEDEDWDLLDGQIFAPVTELLCSLYGHPEKEGRRCARCRARIGNPS